MKKTHVLSAIAALAFIPMAVMASSTKPSDAMMMSAEDMAACEEVLAGWSDEKLMKTKEALSGSASKSDEQLAEDTAAKYDSATTDEALMGLKCKSVLLMHIKGGSSNK